MSMPKHVRPMTEEELAQFPPDIAEKLRQMHVMIDESPDEYTEADYDEMNRIADLEDELEEAREEGDDERAEQIELILARLVLVRHLQKRCTGAAQKGVA